MSLYIQPFIHKLFLQDVIKITSKVPNLVISYEVPYEKFNHMDFLYAIDVGTLLYEEVLKQMRMRIPQ